MNLTPELELGRSLWELVMSRSDLRETHAAYVGTTDFLTIGDPLKKIEAQVTAIRVAQTLTDAELTLVTQIQAAIAA